MCKRSTMLGWLLLGLTGCGAESAGSLAAYDSGGFGDAGSAGYSSAERGLASETTGGSTSSGSYCPACTVCETNPAPKCVVGVQSACSCTDGSSGAQVCQVDGTMGVCECEVPAVVDTCVRVGELVRRTSDVNAPCPPEMPILWIGCTKAPSAACGALAPWSSLADDNNVAPSGHLCCSL